MGQAKDHWQGKGAMATAEQDTPKETDATRGPKELFRYSAWIHLGPDSEICEQAETGACADEEHFHAWCRLPNQVQHQDIRERALAAKARRMRQLRDPEADAYTVLEGDMADLRRLVQPAELVDELLNKDWWKQQLEAMKDVEEREEYTTVDRDRERLQELREADEDTRPKDEYEELERHVSKYLADVETRREELLSPMRDALSALSMDELLDQIREERIKQETSGAFMETYSRWEWLAGTFTHEHGNGRRRRFTSVDELLDEAPEVLDALQTTYASLEASLQRGPKGN